MATRLLRDFDGVRMKAGRNLTAERKSELGQFMTPEPVARFMASMFPATELRACHLLDAGAGVGALSCAFLDRWSSSDGLNFKTVKAEAYEIDASLRLHLERVLTSYSKRLPLNYHIFADDFIKVAVLQTLGGRRFTHAILNPPYRKINSSSDHRLYLRQAGIETVNLYSAFVALALSLLKSNGQLVAIIPRSFCNGPYYRPFREFVLRHAALHQIHLFASRTAAFKNDDVLQENVIIRLERSGIQGKVAVSTSTDGSFSDIALYQHPFNRIVLPDDSEKFIHVPTSPGLGILESSIGVRSSLFDIGIGVSTGPVVDFRLLEHILQQPTEGTVPLLYPGHFSEQSIQWPKGDVKRGNAIKLNSKTQKWLYPNGFYTVVRRFSSKEELRRVVASVVRPDAFPGATMLGFENHLNVFHEDKHGLSEALAYGLASFLNTTAVDENFRRFNGHTQVNATDLRLMKYPDRETLTALGRWAKSKDAMTQTMMDDQLQKLAG
jgi:adenine-specific DNA-methyltransferase